VTLGLKLSDMNASSEEALEEAADAG
jgi:hypothetical protein